jgi:putative transposase
MRNIVKPKTSSKSADIRYFYTLISSAKKHMAIPSEKEFYIVKRDPQVVDEDKFRFEMFILRVEEWHKKKFRVRLMKEG